MRKFLNEYEVDSSVTLSAAHSEFDVDSCEMCFQARIAVLPHDEVTAHATLLIRLIHEGETLEDAEKLGRQKVGQLISLLSISSGGSFGEPVLLRIIDWSENLDERELRIFSKPDPYLKPVPCLNKGVQASVSTFLSGNHNPGLWHALTWYQKAISASGTPDIQIQCFWLCIETLVTLHGFEKVPDRCQKCKTPLYCRSCNRAPTHKPFPSQKIQLLLEKLLPDGAIVFEAASQARNDLMHGRPLADLKLKDGTVFPQASLRDKLGEAALFGLLNELTKNSPPETEYELVRPDSFVRKIFRAHSTMRVRVPLNNGVLDPANIPAYEIKLTREGELFQTEIAGGAEDILSGALSENDSDVSG